jgi:NAD(P)-dependent dehydrogenase (short-subunit alcohol dehydrogenase family)
MTSLDLFRLDGRHAIVAGGAGLLGPTFAESLLEAGALVTVLDVKDSESDSYAQQLRKRFESTYSSRICDLTKTGDVEASVAWAESRAAISILVNAVAIDPKNDALASPQQSTGGFTGYPVELWRKSLEVNLTGIFLVTQAVCRRFEEQRSGVIVNVSSTYGVVGPDQRIYREGRQPPYFVKPCDYSTTKAGVLGFTRYLAAYYAQSGIRVNSLTPGGAFNNHDDAFATAYSQRTLLGRMARRDEYKGAILFLCSDASSYMTGANLIVDGGWTAV